MRRLLVFVLTLTSVAAMVTPASAAERKQLVPGSLGPTLLALSLRPLIVSWIS